MQTVKAVMQEYAEVFWEELGLMTNFKVKLAVKPGAKPIFVCPHSVPFALHEPLEELNQLEEARVINEVAHSDWAACYNLKQ